jgi:hypothetical protein
MDITVTLVENAGQWFASLVDGEGRELHMAPQDSWAMAMGRAMDYVRSVLYFQASR